MDCGTMTDHRENFSYHSPPPLRVALLRPHADEGTDTLLPALRDGGFQAQAISSTAELYQIMPVQRFDIVVVDDDASDNNGFNVARNLRAASPVGIVTLARHSTRRVAIRAMRSGADFHLGKPIDHDLLIAVLHSIGRRLTSQSTAMAIADSAASRKWWLDADGWKLVSPDGNKVSLTSAEHCIIKALVAANGQVVSRAQLVAAVSQRAHDFDPHRVEMIIHRLRRKVLDSTSNELPLRTVRGKGYLFSCDLPALNFLPR
jgi:two-component system, OmpR family, response regulator PhoP